jgi:hypothetical protein
MRKFARLYKLKPAVRLRILRDLDRFGLVAGYYDAKGWPIIHATEKAEPLLDLDPDGPWPRRKD